MPIEYLAGIVDGEGHFGLYYPKNGRGERHPQSLLMVVNTCEALLTAIQQHYGGYKCIQNTKRKDGIKRKTCWQWSLRGKKCEELAARLRPHLIVKAEQVKRVLEYEKWPDRRFGKQTPERVAKRNATRRKNRDLLTN